ncbi:MAG: ferrous iron transport protein B, partial [Spirochaetales bacterium]|nr:ferrous iron transport protein B [Spirochaetales bacterium]
LRLIEEDEQITKLVTENNIISSSEIEEELASIKNILNETPDTVIADYIYGAVNGVYHEVVKKIKNVKPVGDIIDSFAMNQILGVPIFFCIMLIVFMVTIEVGNIFVDWFNNLAGFIFVDGLSHILQSISAPEIITFFAAEGIGAGIQMVISFIPFVFFMFLMLSLLEDSGYMARAAFVMDNFMGKLGLPGKAFVPMIVGFGCSVPAILATRTLDNRRDRVLTVFMVPMMSCGARLPVYALFATAFFPNKTGLIVFSLYMVGVLAAVISGLLMKSTIFHGEPSHLIMELPRYHVPRIKHILLHTWARVKDFIKRAGVVIVVAVFILSIFSSLTIGGGFDPDNVSNSLLASLGKVITPVFEPMGIEQDNWPAAVGLFTGIFAKESVVGTLNAIYSQIDHKAASGGITILKSRFSKHAAYAYLLFILLYMPCIAAVSTSIKEIGPVFGILQALYLTLIAWITATLFFQIVEGHNPLFITIAIALAAVIFTGFRIVSIRIKKS